MRTALWCLAAVAGRTLAVAQTSEDLISEIVSTEEQISHVETELASLLAGSIASDSSDSDGSWGSSGGSWRGSRGSWGGSRGSWDGTTTLFADDCTETSTTRATIVTETDTTSTFTTVCPAESTYIGNGTTLTSTDFSNSVTSTITSSGKANGTLTATVIIVPTTPASSSLAYNSSTPAVPSNSSTPAIPSSGTAPLTTASASFLGNTNSTKPVETSYTTYTSLCTENGTVVIHTHSAAIAPSATLTQSSYTTFTSLCTENGTVVTHTHSQPVGPSTASSEATVTYNSTVYTTVRPATSTISKNGTTAVSTYTYNATSTVTSVIDTTVPLGPTTSPSDVIVTDFTTVYTTVCPATSTISKNGMSSEYTYISTSTTTSVFSTTIPASSATASAPTDVIVTDFTTVYTTICPATSTYTKSGTTSESTYSTTSTVTEVYSLTIPVGHSVITSAPTGGAGNGAGSSSGHGSGGSGSEVSADDGFSSLESWWHSWYTASAGSASNAESTAEVSSENTIVPVPYGSYTPSVGNWNMTTTTMATDYVTIYTTVCPVTSTGSDGSVTTGTTTSTVISSVHTTVTTSFVAGTPNNTSPADYQPAQPLTATRSSPYYPASNKTSSADYASGTGTGYSSANHTSAYQTGWSQTSSNQTSWSQTSWNQTSSNQTSSNQASSNQTSSNQTSSSCSSKASNATCVPCAGQTSSNYGNSGGQPFCGLTIDDNSYEVSPQTCQTVEYFWEITNTTISPDGVSREALVINGQMPGPLIEANWGDWIIVHVKNSMQTNGSTIHWHGLRQNYTNEMDGVASITQCPIAPGESMTYKFRADNYGFSWYHSHYSLQTYEGVFGPMLIHGPSSASQEVDGEQNFVLQDWSHVPVDEMYDAAQDVRGGGPRTLDTGLINGMNVWDGEGERFEMTVKKGSTYKFRFVNTAIQSTMKVYLDQHTFTVISADFVPIVPYETKVLSITNGQRYEVLVTFDQDDASYWLRSDVASECSTVTNGMDIKAIVHYEGNTDTPSSTANTYSTASGAGCADEPLASLTPYYKLNAHSQDYSIDETVTIGANSELLYKWSLSGTTFQSQWGDPTLLQIYQNGTVPDYSGQLAITVPDLGSWVYLIIDSPIPFPHPIHLHGHDFYILAQGTGLYDSSISLNLQNPPRRDVAMMPWNPSQQLGGYLVIAWKTDNPGAWLVHCHIAWHVAMGFALQVIQGLDDIACTVDSPDVLLDTCSSWHAWAGDLVPFDSGV